MGVLDVPLRTFTAAFVPSEASWLFARTLTPIQYSSYVDLTAGIYTGLYGAVFDLAHVSTSFSYGLKGPFRDDSYTVPHYVQGRIRGYISKPGLDSFANWYDLPITLGTNQVRALSTVQDGQGSDGTPAASCIASSLGANNTVYTSQQVIPVLSTKYAYALTPGLGSSRLGFQFPDQALFNTNFSVLNPDVFGQNWCLMGGTAVPAPPNLANVFFSLNQVRYYDVTWDNVSVNTELTFNQNFSTRSMPTPFGWLYTELTNTVTVQGKNYTGFMILTSHDGTKWWLINIIPTDANSTQWNFAVGSARAQFLPTGEMLFHHNHFDNVVLISTSLGNLSNLFKQLPVYPPVDLPKPPADTEAQLLSYRSQSAKD